MNLIQWKWKEKNKNRLRWLFWFHDSLVFMLNVGSHIGKCCCCCPLFATTKKIDEWKENCTKKQYVFSPEIIDNVIRQHFFFSLDVIVYTFLYIQNIWLLWNFSIMETLNKCKRRAITKKKKRCRRIDPHNLNWKFQVQLQYFVIYD